jgi:NAD(P)-dependent dehydrogenase (short-subunit alcohol dehydrogenase family)
VHLDNLVRAFHVNAFGPLLIAKHFAPLLMHRARTVFANVSARVGSIGDNRLGGWYAYRGSKAAQNMFTRNLAIELGRRNPELVVMALHPGTVATDLSLPFRRGVPSDKLFDVGRAARQLLDVMDRVPRDQSGGFFAYDGSPIPW